MQFSRAIAENDVIEHVRESQRGRPLCCLVWTSGRITIPFQVLMIGMKSGIASIRLAV